MKRAQPKSKSQGVLHKSRDVEKRYMFYGPAQYGISVIPTRHEADVNLQRIYSRAMDSDDDVGKQEFRQTRKTARF